MRLIKQIAAFVAASFALVGAQAHAGLVYVGTYGGNDSEAAVNAIITPKTTTMLAKIDYNDNSNTQTPENKAVSAGLFSLTVNADDKSGSFSFDLSTAGYMLEYVVLKASNQFALFKVDPAMVSGNLSFTVVGHIVKNGNTPALSHISFYGFEGAPEIPLPAAAWLMLAGLGGLGFASRRKKAA